MKSFIIIPVIAVALLSGLFLAGPVLAQDSGTAATTPARTDSGVTKSSKLIPECLLGSQIDPKCDNINIFIWLAINVGAYLFTFIGALALLFFVYGGFLMILSQGNQEKIKQGTGAMTAAVIGLVIAFSAYALITFLSTTIGVKTEKSLNFVETAYAQSDEPTTYCMVPSGCWCDVSADPATKVLVPIKEGAPCPGSITDEAPEDTTVDTKLLEDLLNKKVGEKAEGTDVLKTGAATGLNPMNIKDPTVLFSRAINALLAFIGSIALILYIFAGFIWMSASGNTEKVTKAKNILIWTTLGLVAMGASYMIINTILNRIG